MGMTDSGMSGPGLMDKGPGQLITPEDIKAIIGTGTDEYSEVQTPSGAVNTVVRCPESGCPK